MDLNTNSEYFKEAREAAIMRDFFECCRQEKKKKKTKKFFALF